MLPMMLQNLMLALVAVADAFMLGGWTRITCRQFRLPRRFSLFRICFFLLQPEDWRFSGHSTGAGQYQNAG